MLFNIMQIAKLRLRIILRRLFMKSFFDLFKESYKEITGRGTTVNILNITVTGLLIALSMAIESLYIPVPFGKLNFAFIAIAAIGMLFGPTVAFFAGAMCDVLGFLMRPDGGFLPIYILIAMFQGLIYGLVLYRKWGNMSSADNSTGKRFTEFMVRIVIARLLDVIIINLLCNTAANLHYGFIPEQAFSTAVAARFVKNALEFLVDIPLLAVILPVVLKVYTSTASRYIRKTV